jgi:hypothetical protein
MRNNDQILLENIYNGILKTTLNEMAFGLGAGGTTMTIQEIMDFVASKDEEGGNRVIPMSFTSITEPRVRKTGFPYKNLYKVTQTVVELTDYEKKVNRELKKQGEEGEFTAQSSSVVKERISRSIGISKRDLPLLMFDQTQIEQSTSLFVVREQSGEIHYIDKEDAKQYMPPPSPSATGTSVKWRTYGLDKIVGLRIDGREILNSEIDSDKTQIFDFVKDRLKS